MTTTSPRPMLLLGTGELGIAVLDALSPRTAEASIQLDVMVRPGNQASADTVSKRKATSVQGDINTMSEADLATLFSRYDTVVSCIGFAAGPGTQLKLARAALASEVRRYFPWQFGVDYDVLGRGSPQPLFDEQLDVRALLRAQNRTRWVIISVGMFTSFLFEPSFGVVDLKQGIVRALGSWDNAVTVTTAQDIGRLTADIILTTPEFADEVVHVAGDTITYGDLADVVERALGRATTREVWDTPGLMDALSTDPSDTLKRYRAVFALGRGMSWNKDDTFNAQRGLAVTDTTTWLTEHMADQEKHGRESEV